MLSPEWQRRLALMARVEAARETAWLIRNDKSDSNISEPAADVEWLVQNAGYRLTATEQGFLALRWNAPPIRNSLVSGPELDPNFTGLYGAAVAIAEERAATLGLLRNALVTENTRAALRIAATLCGLGD